ncbi:MAG: Fe-Mn family superoxide dismutase [Bacilli bacterium]|nr:Fe-Mn family superoxide dismutase [Bacilli bacterium]
MYKEIILDYQDLSPYLNKETLTTHLDLYRNNLNKLNSLLNQANYDYTYSMKDLISHIDIFNLNIRGEILYYLSSILNHNLYFYNISNNKNIVPVGTIAKDINKYFNSYDNFKKEFKAKALNLKGSGYTFLVMDDKGVLKIINTSNEDSPYYYGMEPIISLDLWEHARFLQYKNNKEAYIDSFFQIIDFKKINQYYEKLLQK